MRRRALFGATALAAAGGVVAALTARRWRSADDPCGPDPWTLAKGEDFKVTTDDGAVLSGTVIGDGPRTVVLVHGWTGTRRWWAPVVRRLEGRDCRVVLYEQRGHGESTVGSAATSIDRLGADVAAVLEQLDLHDAVLVGHSMGGMALQAFASGDHAARSRARALILVATGAYGIVRPEIAAIALRVVGNRQVESAMRRRGGEAMLRGVVGRTVRQSHIVETRDAFVSLPADLRVSWLRAMQQMDLRPGLANIAVPTTIVHGTRDGLVPVARARSGAATIPGARLVELRGAGHMLMFEEPDAITDLVMEAF